MAMRTLENDINQAIEAKKIAGCVLLAASRDGTVCFFLIVSLL